MDNRYDLYIYISYSYIHMYIYIIIQLYYIFVYIYIYNDIRPLPSFLSMICPPAFFWISRHVRCHRSLPKTSYSPDLPSRKRTWQWKFPNLQNCRPWYIPLNHHETPLNHHFPNSDYSRVYHGHIPIVLPKRRCRPHLVGTPAHQAMDLAKIDHRWVPPLSPSWKVHLKQTIDEVYDLYFALAKNLGFLHFFPLRSIPRNGETQYSTIGQG